MEKLQLPLLWFMLAAYVGALVVYAFSFWSGAIKKCGRWPPKLSMSGWR